MYHMTIEQTEDERYPFALLTEADKILLTRQELMTLAFDASVVLADTDPQFKEASHEH